MESLSPQVVSATKLPILNPNEFDLWKIRIEQYFLMTDYSLWEVIVNGDSPALVRVIDGVLQPLKFNTHKDAKTLMEAIEKRFGEDESETKTPQNVPSFVQPTEQVKSPRPLAQHVETSIPTANPKTAIPKPTSNGKCRNRKACFVCKSLDHLIKDCDYHEKKMAQTTARNWKMGMETKIPNFRPCFSQHKCINEPKKGNPQQALKDKGVIDSGCSRHMTWNMSYLSNFKELNGGYVAFGRNPKGGKISRKGKIRTGKLDFDDVYFVKELKFNIFSVSHMCDKKNIVLFTDTECLVLSLEFKLPEN
nr:ribonuclease H-like domain-containing protein [Tanacetum cinerariifolium]